MPSIALPVSLRGQLLSGSRFNPISLFSAGEQGIWLDPSDLTTMFTDRAGTTPVTTPGQTVGLRLDKSKGLVLGSELITNGTFDTNLTGWTLAGAPNPTWSSGAVAMSGTADLRQSFTTVAGRTYLLTFSVSGTSSGSFLNIATANGSNDLVNYFIPSSGRAVFTATTTTTYLRFLTSSSNNFSIDNISVKEIAGNHAVAPTDAARPTYGVEPKTGRRNLLTRTEEFNDAAWIKSGATVTANQETNPLGSAVDADKVDATGASNGVYITSSGNVVSGVDATISVWVKSATGSNQTIRFRGQTASGTNVFSSAITVTNVWQRVSFTWTPSSTFSPTPGILTDASGTAFSVYLWGAQLELGSTATNYQRVGTAFDVTEAGVPTVHYVQYDGTDDSFSTSSIDFTATNKMSVFAGVMKLSDAAAGILVELSNNVSNNTGSLYVVTGPDPFVSTRYSSGTRGSTLFTITSIAQTNIGNAPDQAVLSTTHDIAGDLTTIRRNGVVGTSSTADLGTGNFGNYPLFIGRRNNATLPFNGRDYGILVVGKAVTLTEITDTETWLANKTSGVTI